MKFISYITVQTLAILLLVSTSIAHFGMIIPTSNIVDQDNPSISLDLSFSHPFEGRGMDLVKPESFFVIDDKTRTNLKDILHEKVIMQHNGWQIDYKPKRPGVYWFVMEPQSYWEPAEDVSIVHYTKTAISAYGAEDGWNEPLGLKTEIVPMMRPFGNYTGNSFVGKVLLDGKEVPWATVEVEYYNQDNRKAPSDLHITQSVIADENGIFYFTCSFPGWWGFAALNEARYKIKDPRGNDKNVELGAVLWMRFD